MKVSINKNYFSWMNRTERQYVSPEITQVYIELSTHCNLACRTCVRNSIENFTPLHFSKPLMRRLLQMLKGLPKLRRIVLLGFGEALCNPEFEFHLTTLRECAADIVMVSNAHYLNEETADFIVRLPVDELWLSWDDDPRGSIRNRRGADAGTFSDRLAMLGKTKLMNSSARPILGMEIVAMKSNHELLPSIIRYGKRAGIERFIVSNIFPYSAAMKDEILYTIFGRPEIRLQKILRGASHKVSVRIAGQTADVFRTCPFIERGTIFMTADGSISPCPEMAYSHPAYYFGSRRYHTRHLFGSIRESSINNIWTCADFKSFRESFIYFDFPDCSTCWEPDMCWNRTVDWKDCFGYTTPCGECLWAKNIVICP